MRTHSRILRAAIVIGAVTAAFELGHSRASADDSRLTVMPAVQTVASTGDPSTGNPSANVQLVQWVRPYGYRYRAYYGPYYRGYYAPYAPYYAPAYAYPTYGGYGYTYPAYGYPVYGYGYPAYGGIGVRTGGVGVGIW